MKKLPKLPEWYDVSIAGYDLKVYFDFDPGEDQWFDARAGVGSPGYPAYVEIVKLEPMVILSPEETAQVEQEIMDRIDEEAREYWEGVAESYREARCDEE